MWFCAPEESSSYQNAHYYHGSSLNKPSCSLAPLSTHSVYDRPLPPSPPLQGSVPPRKSPKRRYNKSKFTAEARLSFEVMTGLAVLNGQGRPMVAQDVYAFIIQYWPIYRNGKYTSWKSSVRNRLVDPELFTKLKGVSPLRNTYMLNSKNPGWVQRRVQEEEEKRFNLGLPIEVYGLEDSSVWDAMINGRLGLPSLEHIDLRRSFYRKRQTKSSEEFKWEVPASSACEKKPRIEESPIRGWEFNAVHMMHNQLMYSQEQMIQLEQYYASLPFAGQMQMYPGFYNFFHQQAPFAFQEGMVFPVCHATNERNAPYEYKPNEVPL